MDLARLLAADLRDLAVDLTAGSYTRTTLAMLDRNLHRLVPSTLGASIVLQPNGDTVVSVRVNLVARTVEPHEIAAALEVSLDRLMQGSSGSVVFYASTLGAFTAFAEDLNAALELSPGELNERPPLPRAALLPGMDGLQDFSLVNRALGVLIHRGHTVEGARSELTRRASLSGSGVVGAARAVLSSAYL